MVKKMRIMYVIPSLEMGGAEKLVIDIARNIDKEKYEVKIVTLLDKKWPGFLDVVAENGIEIISICRKLNGINKIYVILKAIQIFNTYKPDIVHTHLNSIIYALPAILFSKVKTRIHTFHSIADRSLKGIYGIALWIAMKYMKFIPVGVGETVSDSISNAYGIKRGKVHLIFNGIDTMRFSPATETRKAPNSEVRLVNVGRMYHVKNPKLLIESFYEALKEYHEIILTMVGDGEEREAIETLVAKLKIKDKVILVGNQENVETYLRNADIYISTSNVEGVPLSVLEAMACGLPIISTKAGGIIDIVTNGESGILVEIGNKEEIKNAIIRFCKNSALRKKIGEKALEESQKYCIKETVRKYEEIYES
jgi:glycosyltransferase involved in cell wall biosynthesis